MSRYRTGYDAGYAQGWADAMEAVRAMVVDMSHVASLESPDQRALLNEFVKTFARALAAMSEGKR